MDAQSTPVHWLGEFGLVDDVQLRAAQHGHIVGNSSSRQLSQHSFTLARSADPLVVNLDERITRLKRLDDFLS
jgi:hypothetical protein